MPLRGNGGVSEVSWRDWTSADWNQRLLEHHLGVRDGNVRPVSRIPATPEELQLIAGDATVSWERIADTFVERVKVAVPAGTSFETVATRYRGWTPDSQQTPPFFYLLWFTCLVAYGYPDGKRGFHDRVSLIMGRSLQHGMGCLPSLWSDLARWTLLRSEDLEPQWRTLLLPEPCNFRTVIGASWYLAFPHRDDRRKLREVLADADLLSEEPPVRKVVTALGNSRRGFSKYFQEDFANFKRQYIDTFSDVRGSPFWRAVRQECLAPLEEEQSEKLPTLLAFDLDQLVPFVACRGDLLAPRGYRSVPLQEQIGAYTDFIVPEQATEDASGATSAVVDVLEGRLRVATPIERQVKRGIVIFQRVSAGQFEVVGGSEAEGATNVLASNQHVDAVIHAFGGSKEPYVAGWSLVVGCRIHVYDEPPPELDFAQHLSTTESVPGIQFVGGVRTSDGYLAVSDALPKLRLQGAESIAVLDADGSLLAELEPAGPDPSDWPLPNSLVRRAPITLTVRAARRVAPRRTSTIGRELRLAEYHFSTDYRGLPSGHFEVEADVDAGARVVTQNDELPFQCADLGDGVMPEIQDIRTRDFGVSQNRRSIRLRDALAAIATRRAGIRYGDVLSLLSTVLRTDNYQAYHDMLRGLVEAGLFELLRRQGWRATILVPRSPQFIAFEIRSGVRATLTGLVPWTLEQQIRRSAERSGATVWTAGAPTAMGQQILKMDIADMALLRQLESEFDLAPTRMVGWPEASLGGPRWLLRQPPTPYEHDVSGHYDLDSGTFVESAVRVAEVAVYKHDQMQAPAAYEVVDDDGTTLGWTRWRHAALLMARELRDNRLPYSIDADGVIRRCDPGVPWLPLWVGRACTVYGMGPPGLLPGFEISYGYPVGSDLASLIHKRLPALKRNEIDSRRRT